MLLIYEVLILQHLNGQKSFTLHEFY